MAVSEFYEQPFVPVKKSKFNESLFSRVLENILK